LRCSRPLCSSQATGGDPPKPAPTPTTRSGSTAGEPRKHPHSGAREGPNENARSLRTQQRARPPHPRPPASTPTPEGTSSTTDVARRDGQLVDVPPMSTTSNAFGSSVGLDAATHR
jgi:hypothetical protein